MPSPHAWRMMLGLQLVYRCSVVSLTEPNFNSADNWPLVSSLLKIGFWLSVLVRECARAKTGKGKVGQQINAQQRWVSTELTRLDWLKATLTRPFILTSGCARTRALKFVSILPSDWLTDLTGCLARQPFHQPLEPHWNRMERTKFVAKKNMRTESWMWMWMNKTDRLSLETNTQLTSLHCYFKPSASA